MDHDDPVSKDVDRRLVAPADTALIDGEPVTGAGAPIEIPNPTTEEIIATVRAVDAAQADRAVQAAVAAFPSWSRWTGEERRAILHRWADLIEEQLPVLVADAVNVLGTPISQAEVLQVRLGLSHLRWNADAAAVDRTERLEPLQQPFPMASEVRYVPVGPAAVIVAYNAPNNMALFKTAPALAAGCTAVLMPSPRAPMSTLWLAQLAQEAGVPPGVLNAVVGEADIGQRLTGHPQIRKVSFTGSVSVGSAIMQQAAGHLADVTLELGGKSPAIVLPDVDVAEVAEQVHRRWSRLAGQACAAPTRVLVHQDIWEEFAAASVETMGGIVTGDPWDPATDVGPLIRPEQVARSGRYVDTAAREDGGFVLARSPAPRSARGWFATPTLIAGVTNEAPIAREEIFGPVAVMLPFRTAHEAVAIANDSELGLAASVFSRDEERAQRLADDLEAGTVWINGAGAMRPDAPFGGMKRSGIGREFGEWGLREYLHPKHVQWRLP